jgi:phosphonate transport system substrate-binding protein
MRFGSWVAVVTAIAVAFAFAVLDPAALIERQETEVPKSIRIGVLPDEGEDSLRRRYQPLLRYLTGATGLETELVIPRDYGHLLELFAREEVDIANFGAMTFLKAHHEYGAVPLVMRDIDFQFRSYFLARTEDGETNIGDFKGKRFAFGSKLSTSGHLMPRHFLVQKGIDPEAFFSQVDFSGAHDQSAIWVRDGRVDLAVANSVIIDTMFAEGRLDANEIRIVWRTPPYLDYVWAARETLPFGFRQDLAMAFLKLAATDDVQAQVLRLVGAGGFLPARLGDFRELGIVAKRQGLL